MITAEEIYDVVKKHRMVNSGDRVVAGVSGGADSMCLLFLMSEIRKWLDYSLEVVHVHHGIRGESADADMEYVKEQCRRLSIPCRIVKADVPLYARENLLSEEEAGRMIRYEAFRSTGPDRIAVAHHLEDSAETILFNLFRGSGLKGISGIPPVGGDIIRPLISCSRKEIEEYCRINGISYREDETNSDIMYARNRIRHRIIPEAEKLNAGAVRHIIELSRKAERAWDYIEDKAETAYKRNVDSSGMPERLVLKLDELEEMPGVIREVLLKKCITSFAGKEKDIGAVHVLDTERIAFSHSGKAVDLPYGIMVKKSFEKLYFINKKKPAKAEEIPFPLNEDGSKTIVTLPEGIVAEGVITAVPDIIPNLPYTKWLDYDKIGDDIVWRIRKPGDRISIKNGSKKVKDLFIEEKLPGDRRDRLYFLAAGSGIIWIPGMRIGYDFRITESTKRVLKVSIKERG